MADMNRRELFSMSAGMSTLMSLSACGKKEEPQPVEEPVEPAEAEVIAPEADASGFVLLADAVPDAIQEIRYYTTEDTRMKEYFYPELDKSVLFDQGYIAEKSGLTRGSTVDLTLFDMKAERKVDMGGTSRWKTSPIPIPTSPSP